MLRFFTTGALLLSAFEKLSMGTTVPPHFANPTQNQPPLPTFNDVTRPMEVRGWYAVARCYDRNWFDRYIDSWDFYNDEIGSLRVVRPTDQNIGVNDKIILWFEVREINTMLMFRRELASLPHAYLENIIAYGNKIKFIVDESTDGNDVRYFMETLSRVDPTIATMKSAIFSYFKNMNKAEDEITILAKPIVFCRPSGAPRNSAFEEAQIEEDSDKKIPITTDISSIPMPDVSSIRMPDISSVPMPDISSIRMPDISSIRMPDIYSIPMSDISSISKIPEVFSKPVVFREPLGKPRSNPCEEEYIEEEKEDKIKKKYG